MGFTIPTNSRLGDNTTRIWNIKDVEPHAWNPKCLDQVPWLYFHEILPDLVIFAVTCLARINTGGHNYSQIVHHTEPLPGKTRTPQPLKLPFELFIEEMQYQHGRAYIEMLKVVPLYETIKELTSLSPMELFGLDLSELNIEKLEEKLRNYRR